MAAVAFFSICLDDGMRQLASVCHGKLEHNKNMKSSHRRTLWLRMIPWTLHTCRNEGLSSVLNPNQ